MASDLAHYVATAPLVDTHDHLRPEREWVEHGGDILEDLFGNYVDADLLTAGAPPEAVRALTDAGNPDVAARFAAVADAWALARHTGYGEAVQLIAQTFYELEELTPAAIAAAAPRSASYRRVGERRRILSDVAGLEQVQVDWFGWAVEPDPSDPDWCLYDLNWCGPSCGEVDAAALLGATGVEVRDLDSLNDAYAALFARYAPHAVAVKSQHCYARTLAWEERDPADAARVLARRLAGETVSPADALVLGDWSLARGVELASAHGLPVKFHTGYFAGNNGMVTERMRPGLLCPLLRRYPAARFVLMHAGYPYGGELAALAKHYTNVWADCCWAWSMNPRHTLRFVREFLHAAPVSKLLSFGADTSWPTGATGYALQARRWLTRALEAEVADGDLTEPQALAVAARLMHGNQRALFRVPAGVSAGG